MTSEPIRGRRPVVLGLGSPPSPSEEESASFSSSPPPRRRVRDEGVVVVLVARRGLAPACLALFFFLRFGGVLRFGQRVATVSWIRRRGPAGAGPQRAPARRRRSSRRAASDSSEFASLIFLNASDAFASAHLSGWIKAAMSRYGHRDVAVRRRRCLDAEHVVQRGAVLERARYNAAREALDRARLRRRRPAGGACMVRSPAGRPPRRRAQGRNDLRLLSTRRNVDAARGRYRLASCLDGLARQIVIILIIHIDDVVPSFRCLARRPSARPRSASP